MCEQVMRQDELCLKRPQSKDVYRGAQINACFLLYQIVPCKNDLSSLRGLRCNSMQCCVCLPQNQGVASAIDAMPSCIESRCPKGHTRHWAHEKGSCRDGLMVEFGSSWANEHVQKTAEFSVRFSLADCLYMSLIVWIIKSQRIDSYKTRTIRQEASSLYKSCSATGLQLPRW